MAKFLTSATTTPALAASWATARFWSSMVMAKKFLAGIFFAAYLLSPLSIFSFAMMVNIWLAVFNMLPIPPLDGSKVLAWDKRIWAGVFIFLIAIFLLFGTGV